MLDYATLRVIWWVLLGLLLIGFAVMDGFDLGIGIILHRVAKTNEERRVVLNTIGPVWEGNQIWLVLGGGAIFAAWPSLYGMAFSGFYFAMLLVLFGLILRPVGFKYRSKIDCSKWRAFWDIGLFIGGFLPALIFGVAMGNILQGVPFYFDDYLRGFYTGSFFALLNPFALLAGALSVAMLVMHGANFLALKTDGLIQKRAVFYSQFGAVLSISLFAIAGFWIAYGINGYHLLKAVSPDEPSNPFYKQVVTQMGGWLNNYRTDPVLMFVPAIAFASALLSLIASSLYKHKTAWLMSALCIAAIIGTVGVSMFPFIMPSSSEPNMSLIVWDASSSQLTLFIMLVATAIFLPIIVLYTSWVYYVLRGKVTNDYVQENSGNLY
jgi:cytochrome d ubiquinol oxidase subunit II